MKKAERKSKKLFKFLFLGGFLFWFFKKKEKDHSLNLKNIENNFLDFIHEEEKEIKELVHHKESFDEYVEDSKSIIHDYFIPSKSNNHHPKILRKKQLLSIFLLALMLKTFLLMYLFFLYPNDGSMNENIEVGVLNKLNNERILAGLEPLVLNKHLKLSATDKAEDMLLNNYFAHTSLDGRMPWDFVSRREYPYLFIGENLGMNFSSAESVHNALMESPSHKKNILNEKYTDVGVVVKKGVIDGKETNLLVQIFGSEKKKELVPNPAVKVASGEKIVSENSVKVLSESLEDENPASEKAAEITKEIVVKPKQAESLEIKELKEEEVKKLEEKVMLIAKEKETLAGSSPLMLGDKAKSFIKKKVPEPNLYKDINSRMYFVSSVNPNDKYTLATFFSKILNYSLLFLLSVLSFALLVNIFVRIRIQHKPAIVQTLVLIIFLFGMYSTKLHFLEEIPYYISLL